MEKMSKRTILLNGLIKENPTFVMILGMCPVLAVTKTLESAIGMGVSLVFVLFFSNLIISLIKNIVPNEIRIPVYIVVIATLVSIVEMVMNAFFTDLYDQLGIFVSLIVVNCIILGRAEAFASKNTPANSMVDALGMGFGFTGAVMLISIFREILGNGTLTIWGDAFINFRPVFTFFGVEPASFFQSNAGAFVMLGLMLGIMNSINILRKNKPKEEKGAVK